ncbi:hypothetical protein CCHR01_12639 [Colletotrichum chrysophilum]|uniref:Uncharacterized protein n=1 Tax=Colletotrichum chrysophilum TaxID=1836956 RepID=A0AAD9EHB1_9PEZI|nr:hypothetical protein CCHR01_12639 [Colletotrichum chrysophilum]
MKQSNLPIIHVLRPSWLPTIHNLPAKVSNEMLICSTKDQGTTFQQTSSEEKELER